MSLERRELFYSLAGFTLLVSWFLVGRSIVEPLLTADNPLLAFAIFNVGFFAGVYLLLYFLGSRAKQIKLSILALLVFIGLDIVQPPYIVTPMGVINKSVELWYVSSDAVAASLYQSFIPNVVVPIIGVSTVWLATYILTPFLLLFVVPILISSPAAIKKAIAG